ncbi:glutamine amidotransferase [Streptomyces sp. NBRC 109706]|uniref:glutamine amidotransferase n=1 Tax=Streptomyces sp. NBRC 109706 TaxID=1550035 RepID=UPI0007813D22|nr:glutamine amidotransferase [Streptomyces sp. NBRC 109706]
MTSPLRVLLAGESWVSESTHYKGFDAFTSVTFHTGAEPLTEALTGQGIEVTHLPAHLVPESFPGSVAELDAYDVVLLSDIGANSLLLHQDTWLNGRRRPNRLKTLAAWVAAGGGLAMAGGYLSFQGFEGKGFFHRTPVEAVLPAEISPYDDRVETPEGVEPSVLATGHPVLAGVPGDWPALLGYNRFGLSPDATLLAQVDGDPLLAVRTEGAGRTLAWASDIAPHWCPQEFLDWPGYPVLFGNICRWLAGRD